MLQEGVCPYVCVFLSLLVTSEQETTSCVLRVHVQGHPWPGDRALGFQQLSREGWGSVSS